MPLGSTWSPFALRLSRATIVLAASAALLAAMLLAIQASPSMAASCTFGGFGQTPGGAPVPTDPSVSAVVTGLESPAAAGVDPATGRLFVPEASQKRVAVIDTRAGTPAIIARVGVGVFPSAVAVDESTGRVYVADGADCTVMIIDGRANPPGVIGRVTVPNNPYTIAVDAATGHVFVALVAQNQIAVYSRDLAPLTTIATGIAPVSMAVDPAHARVLVANTGGQLGKPAAGSIAVIDDAGGTPALLPGGLVGANWPHAVAVDPLGGFAFGVETGAGMIHTLAIGSGGAVSIMSSVGLPPGAAGALALGAIVVPSGRQLVVPLSAGNVVQVFAIGSDGSLSPFRTIAGLGSFQQPAVDSATGSVFVSDTVNGRVVILKLPAAPGAPLPTPAASAVPPPSAPPLTSAAPSPSGSPFASGSPGALVPTPSASAALPVPTPVASLAPAPGPGSSAGSPSGGSPPPIEFVLPGPFDISMNPVDLARSFSLVVLAMLLVGAPTPIFNSTLSAHRALIGRWMRRKGRVFRRGRGPSGPARPSLLSRMAGLSTTWQGLVLYVGVATLLYASLSSDFPFRDPLTVLVVTLTGIAIGTAVSQLPSELYVRRRYHERGRVRVALWTLGLAAICVVIARLTGVQPGYVYGIIGGFTFTVALTHADEGRMAYRGMLILLAVGIVAWFLRVPLQPAPGVLPDGPAQIANKVLAGIFIGAIEATAIGLIPLRFLEGESLFRWSRVRWAVLWGIGIFLFAHVILYPVSSYEPDPSAVGLTTILVSVAIYGTLALSFWWFFRRRDARKAAFRRRALQHGLPSPGALEG